jgi:hypothetical protein
MICPTGRAKYFSPRDWTLESALIWLAKFDFWRNDFAGLVVIHPVNPGRSNGSRECAPDDRLRAGPEIHRRRQKKGLLTNPPSILTP